MHVRRKEDITPIIQPHGETIFELIGRNSALSAEGHSVAHVVIAPGCASIKHFHPLAEESYYILHGRGWMELGTEAREVLPGEIILISSKTPHKLWNKSDVALEFLAICAPAWEPDNAVFLEEN